MPLSLPRPGRHGPSGAAALALGALLAVPALADTAALTGLGLENASADDSARVVAYENRRYRHVNEARARVAAAYGASAASPLVVVERRLGLAAAAIGDTGAAAARVRFPSDPGGLSAPGGPLAAPTRRSLDLELVPLLTYEIGRVLDPVLVRVDLQPRLRYNPWPGARATASLVVPLRNDFATDSLNPDIDRVRPGPLTLEQFAWVPGGALLSGTAGIFAGNRYGLSLGAARPVAGGALLFDAQADLTGFIAFPATGTEYSALARWTGFAGVTWRPPALDLALRVRAQRHLYEDRGVEVELRRSLGDLDLAFYRQRSGGIDVNGVRLEVPLPPLRRPTGQALRVLPVARLPLLYRDEAAPVGVAVAGVASREEFLRQLHAPGLAANADRYRTGPRTARTGAARAAADRVSLTGTTGFVTTPWCGAMSDRAVEVGYNRIPRGGAWDQRGVHRNDVYYAALGFLPRIEAGLRWTVLPGYRAFADAFPESRLTDSDRMLSGRVELLPPRPGRPGLAVGVEDAVGTRRFHATYAVTGIPFEYRGLRSRLALGYASRTLTAARHTLDGGFGAAEVMPLRSVAVSFEYDSERWNAALGVDLGFGLRARAALLDLERASVGAGWSVSL